MSKIGSAVRGAPHSSASNPSESSASLGLGGGSIRTFVGGPPAVWTRPRPPRGRVRSTSPHAAREPVDPAYPAGKGPRGRPGPGSRWEPAPSRGKARTRRTEPRRAAVSGRTEEASGGHGAPARPNSAVWHRLGGRPADFGGGFLHDRRGRGTPNPAATGGTIPSTDGLHCRPACSGENVLHSRCASHTQGRNPTIRSGQ